MFLKSGSKIGIVSPSRAPTPEVLEAFTAALTRMGFIPVIHPQNFLTYGQLAGPDEARAGAIMDMFRDPSIEAILCARGGIGANRLLDKLDYELIRRNPKLFCGFSDITVLLAAFFKKAGLAGFHGAMGWSFLDPHPDLFENFRASLTGEIFGQTQSYEQTEPLREGVAEGPLIGGNLCLLQHLISTDYDLDPSGAILFIEDVEESWSRFDRALHHFALAGKFRNIKGLIVGEMVSMEAEKYAPWAEDYRDTLRKLVPPSIPICVNYPCGHGRMLTTFPMGAHARLDVRKDKTLLKIDVSS